MLNSFVHAHFGKNHISLCWSYALLLMYLSAKLKLY